LWRNTGQIAFYTGFFGDTKDYLGAKPGASNRSSLVDRTEDRARHDIRCVEPFLHCGFYPKWNRNRPDVSSLSNQIGENSMFLSLL